MALHSTNKIFELIKADIKANFSPGYTVHVRNMFGIPSDQWENYFRQASTILIIEVEETYERESNETMAGTMSVMFFIIQQIMAKSKTKYDYLSDTFRDYLMEHGFGRRFTTIQTQYPNEMFQPFYPESRTLVELLKGGLARYELVGHMDFEVYKHV